MTVESDAQPEPLLADRRTRDRALILPVVGLVLLVPPVASIFALDIRVAGIPFTVLYLFGVWALLIVGAMALSLQLGTGRRTAEPGGHRMNWEEMQASGETGGRAAEAGDKAAPANTRGDASDEAIAPVERQG